MQISRPIDSASKKFYFLTVAPKRSHLIHIDPLIHKEDFESLRVEDEKRGAKYRAESRTKKEASIKMFGHVKLGEGKDLEIFK